MDGAEETESIGANTEIGRKSCRRNGQYRSERGSGLKGAVGETGSEDY